MAFSQEILSHIQLPESRRDLTWEKTFLQLFPNASVTMASGNAEMGPDNFPYLLVNILPDSREPSIKVLDWLAEKGIGLVVNAQKNYPDYIFTYGMIWNFKERREFFTDNPIQANKVFELDLEDGVITGAPHPQYLPDYVRKIMKQFLLDQAVLQPRILVVGKTVTNAPSQYDLCFSIESLGSPPDHEHDGILKALSWFLPPHYSLALVSEKALTGFINL